MQKIFAQILHFLCLLIIVSISPQISAQEEEGDSAIFRQFNWFFSQRSAPFDTIPRYAYTNALAEKNSMSPGGYTLAASWENIGPAPSQFQGNLVNGRVTALRYAGVNKVFIGAGQGGVWEGVNPVTGIQWYDKSQNLTSLSSGAIAIDMNPNNPDDYIIYYGSGESIYGTIYTYSGQGIFKSTDHGLTWLQYSLGGEDPLPLRIFRIAVRPGDGNRDELLAATSGGLYRSVNAGVNWSVISETEYKSCTDVVFADPDIVYITGPSTGVGYMRSIDGGASFSFVSNSGFLPVGRTHISVCAADIDVIYAVTDLGEDVNQTPHIQPYRSTNGGNNFTAGSQIIETSQGGFCLFIYAKPDDPGAAYIGAVGLYRTTDNGANYPMIGSSSTVEYVHDDMHDMAFNPDDPDEIVVASDGGVYLSTDAGDTWSSLNNSQLSVLQAYRMSSNQNTIYAGFQDNSSQYKYSGIEWLAIPGGGDGTSVALSKNADVVSGLWGNNGGIFRRVGFNMSSWNASEIGYWDRRGFDWIGALTADPVNNGDFYTARRDFINHTIINFKNLTNGGSSWATVGSFNSRVPPQVIEFSKTYPQIVYMGTSGFYGATENLQFDRQIFVSNNGGVDWIPLDNVQTQIPERYITSIVTTPSIELETEDEVYITLSGFYQGSNEGHVFKSTDGGSNWSDLSGNLPDIPVNDIAIYNSGCSSRNLVVATDYGVFGSTNEGTTWKEFATGFPKTVVTDLEYFESENKLLASTFGRGIYKVDLGALYITTEIELTTSLSLIEDLIICTGGKLKMSDGQSISMSPGKKIIIENGGEIESISGSVYFVGTAWDGIEINENAVWDISECQISSTSTPISITGTFGNEYNTLNLNNIAMSNCGPIQIDNRSNVKVTNSDFAYTYFFSGDPAVCGVAVNGSDNVNIESISIYIQPSPSGSRILQSAAIYINYGSNVTVLSNDITDIKDGIIISNSSPYISKNEIITTGDLVADLGMGLDNSYTAMLDENTITNCSTGVSLFASSPTMYRNTIVNGISESKALDCNTNSSPRLRPQESGGQTIWDAGKNILQVTNPGNGVGINIDNYSIPDIDFGCNTFNTTSYTIQGDIADCMGLNYYLFARGNVWSSFTQNMCDAYYDPGMSGCQSGGGGGGSEIDEEYTDPPLPIIVSYGNGIFDTIQVTNRNIELPGDQSIYLQANNDEILGNYASAITKYTQIIQNYQDSVTAVNSLKKILHCKDKMNAVPSAFSELRSYYQGLIQSNSSDTAFVNVAEELAAKCLVRMGSPEDAITEYEGIIVNNNDSLEVICAELNIIETYMIIEQGGDAPNFTGQLVHLKPLNKEDAYRKIMDRLHKKKSIEVSSQVPKEYKLSQNYPNPFNPLTKINYDLPRDAMVTIVIYDILGREVKRLLNNEIKSAGSYVVDFNASNYASGVYFYRIEAEESNGNKFVDSKKMVLVK